MKKYLLLLALLSLGRRSAQAQKVAEKQVPAVGVSAFRLAHPTAKGVKWEKEDANHEAGFEPGEAEVSVVTAPAGTLLFAARPDGEPPVWPWRRPCAPPASYRKP